MATISLDDALAAAGFRGQSLVTMRGIVLAESGGNPNAHGDASTGEPLDDSYGLAQINMLGGLGPARREQFHLNSNEDLYDPVTNLKAAYQISNGGTNFGAWSTYNSGAYLQHETESSAVLVSAQSGGLQGALGGSIGSGFGGLGLSGPANGAANAAKGAANVVSDTGDVLKSVGGFFTKLANVSLWKRVGLGVAGALLLILMAVFALRGEAVSTVSRTLRGTSS